ncbi:MAG: hypothetical protein KDJ41_07880 [Hyphomicrobiaceae bacterium]|nr:hypothetical protein [Hyphomicrobiaceae bacterium]
MRVSKPVIALAAVGALTLMAVPADAGKRHRERGPYAGYVTAHSDWGNGVIRAPVRQGRYGYQVRLPGGTWIDCRRSCSETLRQETLDFWKTQGEAAQDGGPNYFRFRFW